MTRNIKKILIERKTRKKFYVKELSDDFHTSFGYISKKDLNSKKGVVKSDRGKEFFLIDKFRR